MKHKFFGMSRSPSSAHVPATISPQGSSQPTASTTSPSNSPAGVDPEKLLVLNVLLKVKEGGLNQVLADVAERQVLKDYFARQSMPELMLFIEKFEGYFRAQDDAGRRRILDDIVHSHMNSGSEHGLNLTFKTSKVFMEAANIPAGTPLPATQDSPLGVALSAVHTEVVQLLRRNIDANRINQARAAATEMKKD